MRNLLPFAVAALGIALFSGMDAVMKGLALAIGTFNAVFWRNLAGVGIGSINWVASGAPKPTRAVMRIHAERGAVTAVMSLLFFWSITRLPLAEAIVLTFVSPLIALFLAAWLLGERVGARAVTGSVLAFAGVLVIALTRGDEGGERDLLGVAAAIGSAVMYAYNIVLMRRQAQAAGPVEIAFFQGLVVTGLLALAAPFVASVPNATHWPAIALGAVLSQASLLLLAWAYARAEAQVLAPTEYTAFIWAGLFGWAVFGERLTPTTIAGAALIVAGVWISTRRKDALLLPAGAA